MILKDVWGNGSWQQPVCNKAPGWVKANELTYSTRPLSVKIELSVHLQGIETC